jgi:D-alanyl-D-alanine carboxypeptidase
VSELKTSRWLRLLLVTAVFAFGGCRGGMGESGPGPNGANVPADIQAVFNQPRYKDALWGLQVVDRGSASVLINLQPDHHFYIGSVRKLFSVGELLNQVGPNYTYNTSIYRRGSIGAGGVLNGNLILMRRATLPWVADQPGQHCRDIQLRP